MLKITNLSVATGRKTILSNINFNLERGKVYSILGRNGQGKTILLKSCGLLLDKYHFTIDGSIYFNDIDLRHTDNTELNNIRTKDIRYVFQDAVNTFDPLKKLKYYFKKYMQTDTTLVENLFEELLLGNCSEILNMYSYEVSTGQAQRVCFALALLAQPKLLILDEPTSALDQINGNIYLNLLRQHLLAKDATVLVVTHDLKFALKVSDQMALLQNGNLSEFLLPEEYKANYSMVLLHE